MSYVEPVLNEACLKAQQKRLGNLSKTSKTTLDKAIAQAHFILKNTAGGRIKRPAIIPA